MAYQQKDASCVVGGVPQAPVSLAPSLPFVASVLQAPG